MSRGEKLATCVTKCITKYEEEPDEKSKSLWLSVRKSITEWNKSHSDSDRLTDYRDVVKLASKLYAQYVENVYDGMKKPPADDVNMDKLVGKKTPKAWFRKFALTASPPRATSKAVAPKKAASPPKKAASPRSRSSSRSRSPPKSRSVSRSRSRSRSPSRSPPPSAKKTMKQRVKESVKRNTVKASASRSKTADDRVDEIAEKLLAEKAREDRRVIASVKKAVKQKQREEEEELVHRIEDVLNQTIRSSPARISRRSRVLDDQEEETYVSPRRLVDDGDLIKRSSPNRNIVFDEDEEDLDIIPTYPKQGLTTAFNNVRLDDEFSNSRKITPKSARKIMEDLKDEDIRRRFTQGNESLRDMYVPSSGKKPTFVNDEFFDNNSNVSIASPIRAVQGKSNIMNRFRPVRRDAQQVDTSDARDTRGPMVGRSQQYPRSSRIINVSSIEESANVDASLVSTSANSSTDNANDNITRSVRKAAVNKDVNVSKQSPLVHTPRRSRR